MSDVRGVVYGRAAGVPFDVTGDVGDEGFLATGEGVAY